MRSDKKMHSHSVKKQHTNNIYARNSFIIFATVNLLQLKVEKIRMLEANLIWFISLFDSILNVLQIKLKLTLPLLRGVHGFD